MNFTKTLRTSFGFGVCAISLTLTAMPAMAAHSFTSGAGPRGNTVTASSSVHATRDGLNGSGEVSTSGGRSVSGSGDVSKSTDGTYTGSGSAETGNGHVVDVSGSGNATSGTITVSGQHGSKTTSY